MPRTGCTSRRARRATPRTPGARMAGTAARRRGAPGRQFGQVPRKREDGSLPGRGLRVHAARRDHRAAQGATAVDFAYAIHSMSATPASPPGRPPESAAAHARQRSDRRGHHHADRAPESPAWLGFVVTIKARASIRHYLKNLQRDEAVLLGKRLLEKEPGRPGRQPCRGPAAGARCRR